MPSDSKTVLATGVTPIAAIEELARTMGWVVDDFEEQETPWPAFENEDWFYRFTADGTSMKASGFTTPDGYALTWWK